MHVDVGRHVHGLFSISSHGSNLFKNLDIADRLNSMIFLILFFLIHPDVAEIPAVFSHGSSLLFFSTCWKLPFCNVYVLCTHVEITSLTRHILEIMVSKFSNIMININKVIGNRSTFLSSGVTLCTQNVKYFCHLSVHNLNTTNKNWLDFPIYFN